MQDRRRYLKYEVIQGVTLKGISDEVNKRLEGNQGWIPVGGLTVVMKEAEGGNKKITVEYLQSMAKTE